jgi:drug/metabolite transporter (DMT)-like permease
VSRGPVRALPYAAVALAAMSWGFWALILRHTEAIHALPVALESTIVMAVITAGSGIACLYDRTLARRTWKSWACVAWLGVGDCFNVLLFLAAYKLTIAIAVLTHYMAPIFVALASPFVLREKIAGRTALAIAVSLLGLAVMLAPSATIAPFAETWASAALGTGSAIFYASNVLVNKLVVDSFSTSETMFWHGVFATPLAALLVPRMAWAAVDAHAACFLALAAIGPGALAGLAFVWGLRRMPATHASTLTLLEPVIALTVGATLLGERVGPYTVFGGALILAGALWVMARGASAKS